MGLLENARYASIERGYDYYKRGNVISFKQTSENEYEGKVSGSAEKPYDCLLYTSPSPRDKRQSRMPSSA